MTDPWMHCWTQGWTASAQRFNQFHAPAGSPVGGEFTTSSGAGSGSKASSGKGGKTAAGHPSPPGAAARKARLLAQAKADRAKAHQLQLTLNGLLKQQKTAHAKSVAAAKHAKAAAAAAGHISPHAKKHAAAKHKAAAKHHASLKSRIAGLRQQIASLLAQAAQLDAQAAKL